MCRNAAAKPSAGSRPGGPADRDQRSTLLIDLDAVIANWRLIAGQSPSGDCAAAVKAEAYGLGMIPVSKALARAGCRIFFVASEHEARSLRAALPKVKIYILNGLLGCDLDLLREQDLRPVLNDMGQVRTWADYCRSRGPAGSAIHFDTGLNRLGLDSGDTADLLAQLALFDTVRPDLVMSHLACSEDPGHPLNREQLGRFNAIRSALPPCPASLASSAGSMMSADYHFDILRPGVGLFGGNPFVDRPNPFAQTITLKAKILQIREIDGPLGVGYGATPSASGRRRIATVGAGYADGYLRNFDNAGVGIVNDKRVPVVGRISMDLTTLDVTDCREEDVRPGRNITLVGDGITMDELQDVSGMSQYQLLTSLGARYRRVYLLDGREVTE